MELGEETRGRELLRLLLQAHIDGRGHGDVGPAVELLRPDPRPLYRQKTRRRRCLLTIFGKVYVERFRYASRRGSGRHPLDEQLQLPARSYSYEIQGRLVLRAVQGPFQEAIEAMEKLTEVRIPKRSAEILVIDASGSVEGACKNLIKDRMERSGMRWTPTMAEAMVKMRALYLSGDFEEYWDYHIEQEQRRLYPKGLWRSAAHVVSK